MMFRFWERRLAISGASAKAPRSEKAENREFRALFGAEFGAILGMCVGIFRARPARQPESGLSFRRDWFECQLCTPIAIVHSPKQRDRNRTLKASRMPTSVALNVTTIWA
jgi:hypothetical protein